jgi:hypothetical protein
VPTEGNKKTLHGKVTEETYYFLLSEVQQRTVFWGLLSDFPHKGKLFKAVLQNNDTGIAEVMTSALLLKLTPEL